MALVVMACFHAAMSAFASSNPILNASSLHSKEDMDSKKSYLKGKIFIFVRVEEKFDETNHLFVKVYDLPIHITIKLLHVLLHLEKMILHPLWQSPPLTSSSPRQLMHHETNSSQYFPLHLHQQHCLHHTTGNVNSDMVLSFLLLPPNSYTKCHALEFTSKPCDLNGLNPHQGKLTYLDINTLDNKIEDTKD